MTGFKNHEGNMREHGGNMAEMLEHDGNMRAGQVGCIPGPCLEHAGSMGGTCGDSAERTNLYSVGEF